MKEASKMKLGDKGTMILITILAMAPPLSTDMYMPALPGMAKLFGTSEAVMNMTLILFFLFFAIGMLFFGPASDKYGRKPVLVVGLIVYGIASLVCGLAQTIVMLILFRVVEALGAGCMVSISTAMIKDLYSGKKQASVLAATQAMVMLAPMIAPILGAFIINYFDWRATFYALAGIALAVLLMTMAFEESLAKENRYIGSWIGALSRLGVIVKNRDFTKFLLIAILFQLPIMAFVSSSSYVFVDQFGTTTTQYSLYFALNMGISVLGPVLSIKYRHHSRSKILIMCSCALALSAVLVLAFGHMAPLVYVICYIPANIAAPSIRPYSTGLLINMQEHDTGSASSIINFANSLGGTLGMLLITSLWSDYITGLGMLIFAIAIIAIGGTLILLRRD